MSRQRPRSSRCRPDDTEGDELDIFEDGSLAPSINLVELMVPLCEVYKDKDCDAQPVEQFKRGATLGVEIGFAHGISPEEDSTARTIRPGTSDSA